MLLHEPMAIFMFKENEVVIPSAVLEEIDSKKRNMDEIGRNARQVTRILDSLRAKGKLNDKIVMDHGGILRVELNHRSLQKLHDRFLTATNDNRIIAVALNLKEEEEMKEIIDEAQNLTKHEVKTILTRVGERSKIVLLGDPYQIDHPYLDEMTNGLTYVAEKFKTYPVSGHIRLEKGERSSLAQLAADIL